MTKEEPPRDESGDDDFNLLRNKRVFYPTIIGLIIVIAILLSPLFL